jgi:hypothetical protein
MRGSRRRWRWRRSEETGRSPSWQVSSGCIRTRSTTGRSSCWTVQRAFRGRRFSGGGDQQRGAGRYSVPADRPVEGRKRFFGTKARQMSRAERRAMVERANPVLPVSQQCRLLAVSAEARFRPDAYGITRPPDDARVRLAGIRTKKFADSLLEGDGFELVVPRCVVGGRLADAIAESAASSSLRRARALGRRRDDQSKMPRNPSQKYLKFSDQAISLSLSVG